MIICDKNECTGCAACLNICPHNAISLQQGPIGHLYPVIDAQGCIECGACYKVCPNNKTIRTHFPSEAYIATATEREESKESTSAGIASVLSASILENGGVVYGCCGEEIESVRHIRISKKEDVRRLKGSKYVQSYIGRTLQDIRKDLLQGISVLFIGTPCQVAGLYGFLGKDYDNLFTIDLVCHGVPSQRLLTEALQHYLGRENLHNLRVSFREKNKGKSLYGLFVRDDKGNTKYWSVFPKNEYITGFLTGLFYRESCYNCKYASQGRISDITIGDYWDREKNVILQNSKGGLSMLIINTRKGSYLVNEFGDKLNLQQGLYNDFVKRNGQLDHPMDRSNYYYSFMRDFEQYGFIAAAKINLKAEISRIKKNLVLNKISQIIYSIPGAKNIIKILRRK